MAATPIFLYRSVGGDVVAATYGVDAVAIEGLVIPFLERGGVVAGRVFQRGAPEPSRTR